MALTTGTRLGPYEIESAIGAGGMGEVYRARDRRLDRVVAIKVLPSEVASVPELRARFEREARAAASLNHPHICTLHDVGNEHDTAFVVMEYLQGETLAERLSKRQLAMTDVLQIATDIAGALDAAHRAGIVHRDLKPANVMLTRAGAKLLDFGLAKNTRPAGLVPGRGADGVTSSEALGTLTSRGTILGTFNYMAPEQLEGEEADARADIWAFGCVLYEMTSGRRAFDAKSRAGVISAILSASPPPLVELVPLVPPPLDRIVRGCLVKEREERIQSAHDLLLELHWLKNAGSGIVAAPAPPRARRRLWRTAALLASVALAVAIGFVARPLPKAAVSPTVRFTIAPPAGHTITDAPAISPDGRQLAIVLVSPDSRPQIWLRSLDDDQLRPIAGTTGGSSPFWSADSRSLGFFADGKLKRIDPRGGEPVSLCDAPTGRGATWTSDGRIIVAPTSGSPLMVMSDTGGQLAPLTTLDASRGEISHRFPHWLPTGKVLYAVMDKSQASDLRLVDATQPSKVLSLGRSSSAQFAAGHLFFAREGTLYAQRFDAAAATLQGAPAAVTTVVTSGVIGLEGFAVSPSGTVAIRARPSQPTQLTLVDRDGRVKATVGEPLVQGMVELSPDGRQVATARQDGAPVRIWTIDLERGVSTRVSADAHQDTFPVWSPDGGRLIFASNRAAGGNTNLYMAPVDGSGNVSAVLEGNALMRPGAWHANGTLVWSSHGPPHSGIWSMMLDGDRKPVAYLETSRFRLQHPRLSPDGQWIAYVSNQSGRREVYLQRFPDRDVPRQVSIGGGISPRWRKDGGEIYYVSANGAIMAVSVSPGARPTIGRPSPLFPFQQPLGFSSDFYNYDVSADGQQFLLNQPTENSAPPLTVILNWSPPSGES